MPSNVSVSLAGQSFELSSTDLLLCLIIALLVVVVFAMALSSGRRATRKFVESADILVVQLERIGNVLERMAAQNASTSASADAQRRAQRVASEWAPGEKGLPPPRGAADRAIQERAALNKTAKDPAAKEQPTRAQESAEQVTQAQTADGKVAEPARSLIHSMLGG